jgi:DNA processing protein
LPDENAKSVAIVGARGRSAHGSEVTVKLAKELSAQGVQIISGLAKGIDADAHRGAIEGGTKTFAVLGCGVDVCYPTSNRYLYHSILEQGGGIISEYLPGTQPRTMFFPARNRIISGLSDCVAVMEARIKSGSLITADFAMEQGRDVYALPGRITDPLSAGCNHLITQGAGIIESVEEFMKELEILSSGFDTSYDFLKNLLEKDESLVYSVTDFRPLGIGMILEKTGIPFDRLLEILNRLESLGLIKETFPNHYIRSII